MSKHCKVLWLHPHFLNWMGGHRYIYEVIRRLDNRYGCEITLFTGAFSSFAERQFQGIGIKTGRFSGFSTNNPIYWLFLPFFLKKELNILKIEARNTDVIISSMFPMNVLATRLSQRTIQLCYEPYAFFHDPNFVAGFPLPKMLFIKLMARVYSSLDIGATKKADKILTLSRYNRDWIKKVYSRSDAIVVYEGVDTSFFKPKHKSVLERKYKNHNIIFHSTDFTAIKGTPYLIQALPEVIREIPDVRLLISHTLRDQRGKQEIVKLAQKLGVLKNIKLLGFLDLEELPYYYTLAKVAVQPSVGQSMSLSIKEVMACEVPIITSLEGKEQTKDGEAGFLVDSLDTRKLAKKIIELIKNPKRAKKMGKRGRQIVLKKFSWDAVAERFWKVICEARNERT